MAHNVRFRDVARDDLEGLSEDVQRRVLRAIEDRLTTEPAKYGVRLRRSLAGLWKLRVGDYRIVFELSDNNVTIWAVRHRKDVYREVERRLS